MADRRVHVRRRRFDLSPPNSSTRQISTPRSRFDQLSRPAPRLENAAIRVVDRFFACFAARDWGSMAETVADDMYNDDRNTVVNAGIRRGRVAEIANMGAFVDVGITNTTLVVIATRGERLVLVRICFGPRLGPRRSITGCSALWKSTPTTGSSARVLFDPHDIDAAFAELDARYLAGEAAPHAHTWSVIAGSFAASTDTNFPR